MEGKNNSPSLVDCLGAETREGLGDAAALPRRLDRYSEAHHRALAMSTFIKKSPKCKDISKKDKMNLVSELNSCGSYLVFNNYFRVDQIRLSSMVSCRKALLCPLCAMRRGAKLLQSYLERVKVISESQGHLQAYLVTLTVKDGAKLGERFRHLEKSVKKLGALRNEGMRPKKRKVEYNKVVGAVGSYEFKRGRNSGLWHPHYHAVWICDEKPDQKALSAEWLEVTGDSYIVDVTPFQDQDDLASGFLEVFKYALKFSDLELADNWQGYLTLKGRRLINSVGAFRGVQVPESNLDGLLADEPYLEMFYKFRRGVGYNLESVTEGVRQDREPSLDPVFGPRSPDQPFQGESCSSPRRQAERA